MALSRASFVPEPIEKCAVAAELAREDPFASSDRLLLAHGAEAVFPPGLFAALDDERGRVGIELVGVRPEPAAVGLLEDEGEGVVEFLVRAEPDEPALAGIDVRLEMLCMGGARARIRSIRRHDQVVAPRDARRAIRLRLKPQGDAELPRPFLQQEEQPLAADAAETVTGGD